MTSGSVGSPRKPRELFEQVFTGQMPCMLTNSAKALKEQGIERVQALADISRSALLS